MTIDTAAAYSVYGFIGGAMLSKTGSLTVGYILMNPSPYSLDETAIEWRHAEWQRSLKNMVPNSIVHKQDVYLLRRYDAAAKMDGDSFITRAERSHFNAREYLEHRCILAFTLAGLKSLEKAYNANPLQYKEALEQEDRERLKVFLSAVETAITIIRNAGTQIVEMDNSTLRGYLINYVNAFAEDGGLRDIRFGEKTTIGENTAAFFSISDENFLPDNIDVYVKDDTLPTGNTNLFMSPMEKLGIHIRANHVYNQILYFEGDEKLKSDLKNRVTLFGQHRNFATSIKYLHAKLEAYEQEVIEEQAMLCRAHFSVMVWDTDQQKLNEAKKQIRETLRLRDIIRFYEPSFEGARDLFLGTIIGRANKLHPDFYFLTDTAVGVALLINYSTFKSDREGVYFNDRIFQLPLKIDIWDEDKNRVPARNAMFIASTGGGKSATVSSIIQQLIEQGYKAIICEFGNSFSALCRLYPDISIHIEYDGTQPLGINPFYVASRKEVTIEKMKTLTQIVLKFWRKKEIRQDTEQVTSLTKILQDYYEHQETNHSFPDFYNHIQQNGRGAMKRLNIPEDYFDIQSFLHICSEFMPGGIYENVCKIVDGGEDKFRNKDFVLFELTKIKKDPFLASLIMGILFDTIENKILSDRSTRGVLVFDEYAETQAMEDVFTGEDIHPTVAFCYQKLRKENGAIWSIIQSPAQLPENNYTKGIIANTQILYVLPTTETVYDSIIKSFSIKNNSHINLMKSIRNDFARDDAAGKRPYSEIFIRFLDLYATAVRLEFSQEKFLALQTDGKVWNELNEEYRKTGNMETTIVNYINKKNHGKATF